MKNTKKRGFTIVELVIVIAVIAILASVLIPTFANVVRAAKESKELQEARNAYTMALAEAFKGGEVSTDTITKDQVPELGDWTVTFDGTGTNATVTKTVSGTTVTYKMTNGNFAKETVTTTTTTTA